jgi:hypothetical protein
MLSQGAEAGELEEGDDRGTEAEQETSRQPPKGNQVVETALDTGSTVAMGGGLATGAGEAAAGLAGGATAGAGGVLGRFGNMLKVGGGIASKGAAPLAIAQSLYENKDELMETGKVDPTKQLMKAGGGLADMLSLNDNLFSMKRLEGFGNLVSGTTGAALGVGTQAGSAVKSMIPDDVSDSIVDGIVGLFGGETNADRKAKADEVVKKQNEEMAKKKADLAASQKKPEAIVPATPPESADPMSKYKKGNSLNPMDVDYNDTAALRKMYELRSKTMVEMGNKALPNATDEDLAKEQFLRQKQKGLTSGEFKFSPGNKPVNVDSNGNPIPVHASSELTEKNKEKHEAIAGVATSSVEIVQPPGSVLRVALADKDGKIIDLTTSTPERRAAAAEQSPGFVGPPSPEPAPAASPVPSVAGTTAAPGPGAGPARLQPNAPAEDSTAADIVGRTLTPTNSIVESLGGMEAITHQGNAAGAQHGAYVEQNAGRAAGSGRVTGRSRLAEATEKAQAADRAIPAAPAPVPTTSKPTLGQTARNAASGVAGMAAVAGVPGAGTAAGAISGAGSTQIGKDKSVNVANAYTALKAAFIKKGFTPEQSSEYAKAASAQFAQESKWGEKQSGKNNFFGIKAKKGEAGTSVMTHEYEGGNKVNKEQVFKDYGSVEEGMAGYVDFITKNPRYAKSGAFQAKTAEEYATKMQQAGYATDPNYAKNLSTVMEGKTFKSGMAQVGKQPSLADTAKGAATGIAGMAAVAGVPGASTVAAIAANPKGQTGKFTAEGLTFKNKKENMGGGETQQGTLALSQQIQKSNIAGGVERFTAMNDEYHQSEGYKEKAMKSRGSSFSHHQAGLATDFTLKDPKQHAQAKADVEKMLAASGLDPKEFKVIDEYQKQSGAATGNHIHVNFKNKEASDKYAAYASGGKMPDKVAEASPIKKETSGEHQHDLEKEAKETEKAGVTPEQAAAQGLSAPEPSTELAPEQAGTEIPPPTTRAATAAGAPGKVQSSGPEEDSTAADIVGRTLTPTNSLVEELDGMEVLTHQQNAKGKLYGAYSDQNAGRGFTKTPKDRGNVRSRAALEAKRPLEEKFAESSINGRAGSLAAANIPPALFPKEVEQKLESTQEAAQMSGALEASTIGDKQQDANRAANNAASTTNISGGGGERSSQPGSQTGVSTPLDVRNCESSIRRFTDALIAFSFG